MKHPDEVPAISVQEHLKITVSDKTLTGNLETQTISEHVTTKVIMSQRVK